MNKRSGHLTNPAKQPVMNGTIGAIICVALFYRRDHWDLLAYCVLHAAKRHGRGRGLLRGVYGRSGGRCRIRLLLAQGAAAAGCDSGQPVNAYVTPSGSLCDLDVSWRRDFRRNQSASAVPAALATKSVYTISERERGLAMCELGSAENSLRKC